ncbi:penicillin-binding protein 1C [Ramlibacter sp.]|uniref:penicillin-binding protein 1C n=1 Tax=Ramlibacter sp. TaxID=1917967 RepID=UPI003D0F5D1B
MRWFASLLFCACVAGPAAALPSFEEVKRAHRSSESVLLDRQGEVLHRLRTDASVRRGAWVTLDAVSPALRTAILLSEDKRFYEHSGVDWRAVSSAAWGNLWNTRTRGASTLTMQLAGLLDDDLKQEAGGRGVVQKVGQAIAAQVLDRRWRKDQILEAYLNLVPFRGELAGVDALSRTLFGKAAHGLDDQESAVAAALVRAPNARPPQIAARACGVLKAMQPGASCLMLDAFTHAALQHKGLPADEGIAPHLARRLLPAGAPPRVSSTLRAPVQRVAVQALHRQLAELRGRNVHDGAVVVLDNASGEVLAWVGSSGVFSDAAEVDGVTAPRQPGSTLKPFLYAQAISQRRLTAASLLEDSPTHIPTASGLYIPQNYDRGFKGWVTVRTALAASLNVPAVRTLVMVSPEDFARQLRAVGLPLKEGGDYYGYSLALGSAEVSLLNLTNAYRTLANGGKFGEVAYSLSPSLSPSRPRAGMRVSPQAIDSGAAFIVGDILSDPNARSRTFGTDSLLGTRFWTAVKTGTSKDMRDNWAVGWSQRYTVGVWVGNADGAAMHDVSGTSGAAPVWADVMRHLHRDEPRRAPVPPTSVVSTSVVFGDALEAPRSEWFLPGTQQPLFAVARDAASSRATDGAAFIRQPAAGAIIALDPDIPPDRQRLHFAAGGVGPRSALRWRIDGKEFARGNAAAWLPWPGRHRVQLVDAAGAVLDEVRIEVRGAGVR